MLSLKEYQELKRNSDKKLNPNGNFMSLSDYQKYQNSIIKNNQSSDNNFLDDVSYLGKNFKTGVVSGVTNMGTALTTDIANNFEKGNNQGILESLFNVWKSVATISNPTLALANLFKTTSNAVNKNFNDDSKNTLQKIIGSAKDVASSDNLIDYSTQYIGSLLPNETNKKASEWLLEANDTISQPSKKLQAELALESENKSDLMKLVGSGIQSVGNMMPSVAATALTKNPNVGLAVMGLGAKGGKTNEMLEQGSNLNDAVKKGNLSGATEILTEMMTGGVKIFGKGTLDDAVESGIKKMAKTKLQKELLQKGYEIGGEILEETISDVVDTALAYSDDSSASYSMKDWGETAASTIVSTVALNLLTGGLANGNNMINKNKVINQYAKENNISKNQVKVNLNNEVNKIFNDQKTNEVTSYSEDKESKKQIENNLLNKMINDSQFSLENKKSNTLLANDNNLYSYKKSDNIKVDELRKSAVENKFNSSETTTNFMNMLEKIIIDKDIAIKFDNNLDGNINGKYENGVITINPSSDRAGEFIAVHELTHAIGTDSMRQIVDNYRKSNPSFNKALESILESYNTSELTEEAMADVAGQLLGNQEFINNLSTNNPNLFKRIYQEIKYLWHQFRGYKNKSQFIEDLQYKWEQAYRSSNKLNNSQNYSLIGETGVENLKNNHLDIYNNLMNALSEAKKMDVKGESNNKIWQKTGWFKDKNNRWKFEVSDKNMNLKNIDAKVDHEYKLSELIEHDTLFKLYPELKDLIVRFKDFSKSTTNGSYSRSENVISINNRLLHSDQNIEGTLIHEIQHAIQNIEKFETGASTKLSRLRYYESLGEIEASNTRERFEQEKYKGYNLDYIAPSSVDKNAKHKDLDEYLKNRTITDKIKDKIFSKVGVHNAKENQEVVEKDSIRDNDLVVGRVRELDNSSFSLDSNAKRYEDLFKTNYIEYFRKDNGDVRANLIDSNHNLINQIDLWSNTDAIKQLGNELGDKIFESANDSNQKIVIGNNINNLGLETDYFMNHRPTETGAFASDITDNGNLCPLDMYDHPEYYFNMDKAHKESFEILKKIRNNPDAEVTMYRATPGKKINFGDWVTLSKTYAEQHNQSQLDGKGNILEQKVKAKDLQYAGDDINEFGYYPDMAKYSKKNPKWQEYLEANFKSSGTRTNMKDLNLPLKNKEKVNLPIADNKIDDGIPSATRTSIKASKEDILKDNIDKKISKEILKKSAIAINTATKTGQKYLNFNNQEKKSFRENLKKYLGTTKADLTNAETYNDIRDIVEKYANREINYINEELTDIKKEISNLKIKITPELKRQITDYNDFRKSNFGKLRLGNEGQNIDVIYRELSDMYPSYFNKEVIAEADMLEEISNFMNQDSTITQKYRLPTEELETIAVKVYNSLLQTSLSDIEIAKIEQEITEKTQNITREIIQEGLLNDMGITSDLIDKGNDISSLEYQRTDPIRLNEKVFGFKTGQKINDATINRTKHNEANRIRFLNQERDEIKGLGIKAQSKESAAVQKWAEKEYINKYGELVPYGQRELDADVKDKTAQEKIKKAAEVLRNKYDNYIDQVNDKLIEMGYDPIPKRKDYMRHFQELSDKFSKWGTPLNRETVNSENLPTDINGLTEQFKPGKSWFASAQHREGVKTVYDAITGIDKYLDGVSNLIYHTEDIQRYRALSKFIRNTYGKQNGFENLENLTDSQLEQRIKDIQNNKLSGYVAWLDEQANALANKKGAIDRAAERMLGRKIYKILETAKKQVGSNMTGLNVRSSLTNFASAVQGASKTNKISFIKGTISTIKNIAHDDGLINKSDFLTSRFGSDNLSKKIWQKVSNAGQIFMTASDYFTANQIWRSKYFENLSNGLTEQQSIKNADDFAARIMGDRSKGSTAEIFNSKTLGLLTQFQLEVNNQWSSIIHDNKMDLQSGNKSGATVVFQLGQLAALSYFFNNFMKSLTGSDVIIDPIDLLKKIFNPDDDKSLEEKAEEALGDVIDDLPFVSFLTGGRIPISEAFKGGGTLVKKLSGGTDDYGNKIDWNDVGKDTISSAFYWLLPTGYGQLRKTYQGLSMYDENLPIAGSYTDSGRLRFEADTSLGGKAKAALFGQWSSKEARDYLNKKYNPLTENQINEVKETGLKVEDYRDYRNGLKEQSNAEEKVNYIYNLPYSTEQKNILVNNALNRNTDIDLSNYGEYGSLAEFDYANKNPEKYSAINQICSYGDFLIYKSEIDNIKSNHSNIEERKKTIKEYINSLDLNRYQKLMLEKLGAGYSIKAYKNSLQLYINDLDLTKVEKEAIDKVLFE